MKKMTCNELGGACDLEFQGETFDEIAAQSKQHGMEMFQAGDKPHLVAMDKMRTLMESPEKMQAWFSERKKAFEALPHMD